MRLEWELTSSRISHFLPVFIRNLGHDSSDPSHPDKYMHARGGQSPRSLCSFLCAILIPAHLSSNSLVASGFSTWARACVLAAHTSRCHSCYTGLSRETLVQFTLSCYLRRDILVARVSKQRHPSFHPHVHV